MMMYHQIKFGCKKISTLVAMTETVVFDYILALTVTLTLKIANQSFHMTLWSMMLHHQTKFDIKRSVGQNISSRQTFTGI